jgi:spore maturation protein CgeB
LALLTLGNYQQGWAEYEWRFRRRNANSVYPYQLKSPRWQGESFKGRRLLVYCEQGLGDVLQFARYLPIVKQLGGTLILEVQRSLLPLLQSMDCVDTLITFNAQRAPSISHDWHIPLLSLAGMFNTTAENMPDKVPYLHAVANHSAWWRRKMAAADYKIGLVWATSGLDSKRNIPLRECYSWFNIPGVRFFSLQKGASIHQLAPDLDITDLGNQLSDFRDTAAVVGNLDLVISVDTAVAHLAGAMGKPVWVLLPLGADWRWPPNGSTTPWYPTATLYRQDQPGTWRKVQTDVYEALIQKRGNRLNHTRNAQKTNQKRVDTHHGLRKRLFRSTLNIIPGSTYGKSRFQQPQANNRPNNRIKNVLLISQIYGGSLEVIRYLRSGFLQAGCASLLQDNSSLFQAYRHIEAMPIEHPDKKNQYHHFLRMIDQELMASVEKHKPDLVIAIAQSPINSDTVTRLKRKGIAYAYWFVEDYRFRTYWAQKAPVFDYFFTIQRDEHLKRHFDTLDHTTWRYLPLACDPLVHKPWKASLQEKRPYRCQIGFMGAPYVNRIQVFEELVDWDFAIWGQGWDDVDLSPRLRACIRQGHNRISMAEAVRIYSSADIVVNLHSSPFEKGINRDGDFVNPRCFEVAGCGGFQLTDFRKELPEILTPGEQIIVFDTITTLKKNIEFWLSNLYLRRSVSQKGQKCVYENHTYLHRAENIVRIVEK